MFTEQASIDKRNGISRELEKLAKEAYGDVPREDNNIGVFCLYGPGSVLVYQPDGIILNHKPERDLIENKTYVMGADEKLRQDSGGVFSASSSNPLNTILKAIATKKISTEEMSRIESYVKEHGRFTDWNQVLLVEEARRIYNYGLST